MLSIILPYNNNNIYLLEKNNEHCERENTITTNNDSLQREPLQPLLVLCSSALRSLNSNS